MITPNANPDTEDSLTTPDGTLLHYTDWQPDARTARMRATILLSHGYGEHLGRYGRLARQLTAKGYHVGGCDHRGMGRSGGPRMVIDDYDTYVADLDTAYARLRQGISDGVPAFVFGHSMGGLVALRHAQTKHALPFAGTILSGPLLGVGFPVPAWQTALGKVLARVAPRYHFPLKLRPELLTHDVDEQQAAARDPLIPGFTTPAWFMATYRAMEQARADIGRVHWPTLWQVGDADQVCSPIATEEVYLLLKGHDLERQAAEAHERGEMDLLPIDFLSRYCHMIMYGDLMHELYNELSSDRERVFDDLLAWLDARLALSEP